MVSCLIRMDWVGLVSHRFDSRDRYLSLPAKSTFSRLTATAEERAAREKRLADAVRTILDCIGEDPNREGLLKTPERYAQAVMWMTRGYEERLAGVLYTAAVSRLLISQMSSTMQFLQKITMKWSLYVTSTSPVFVSTISCPLLAKYVHHFSLGIFPFPTRSL